MTGDARTLRAKRNRWVTAVAYPVLLARKVLASPVTLANGESIQVIYEISSVYPA